MTDHQPLARVIRGGDFGQVLLVQQGELQGPFLDQFSNRSAGQRGDPPHAGMLAKFVDLRLGQHAAIPHQHHPLETKALTQLLHLIAHRGRVAGVARINLHRHRTPRLVRHHPVNDDR